MLQRMGEFMFRHKWWVITSWVVILAILGFTMMQVGPKTSSSLSIPGTKAMQALDRFHELFPDTGSQSSKVVVAAPDGKKISDYQTQITTLTSDIAKVPEVSATISPFDPTISAISKDGTIGFITVQLKPEEEKVKPETTDKVESLMQAARTNGLTVEAGGDLKPVGIGEILGVGEIAGVVIALVVLVVTLGSLVAAGMPILIAIVTVGLSMAGLFSLSHIVELNSTAPVLAVMLGLAVGIDYSLFIINRYRTYIKEGYGLQEAAGRSIATAGNAVIFAAATVVIALVSLSVVNIPFMTVMGISAAATVAIAALVAVTLIPAVLSVVGYWIFGVKTRKKVIALHNSHKIHKETVNKKTFWYKAGDGIVRFRWPILIASLAVIGLIAWPVSQLRLGLPTDETAAPNSSARQAYDLLAKGFGAGYNGPLLVVVEGLPAVSADDKAAVQAQLMEVGKQKIAALPPEQQAVATSPAGQQKAAAELAASVEKYAPYYQLQKVAENIAKANNVQAAQAALTTDSGTKGVIQVTPKSGPSEKETADLVAYLRNTDNTKKLAANNGVTFAVTGTTAMQVDINEKLANALPVYLAVVVGLSFLILMLAFRSILIPLKATLGFLLSVFAMFGALVAVFQFGWFGISEAPGPIVSFIPIIAIGILFGLAMDYEFFLVSGMQEAYHKKKDAKQAVVHGFALGARVVVAAGLIMVAVFAGFIGNHDATIQSMGFALAVGILVDAFIVRMIIVPIVMSFLGKAAWWIPKWLDKILPKVSIEGKED